MIKFLRLWVVGITVGLLSALVACNIYTSVHKKRYCGYADRFVSGLIDSKHTRCIVLFHGFVGSPADFGDLPEELFRQGFDVLMPVLPGHCKRPEQLENVNVAMLENFALDVALKARADYEYLGVAGFSMGGALSLRIAEQVKPDALALICPYFKVKHRFFYLLPVRTWTKLLKYVMPYAVKNSYFCMVNRSAGKKNVYAYDVFPLSFAEQLYKIGDLACRVKKPKCPVLMVYSEVDYAADSCVMKNVSSRIGAESIVFSRSNHHLMHDYDRREAVAAVCCFFREKLMD